MIYRKLFLLAASASAYIAGTGSLATAQSEDLERTHQVQAAMVVNFAKYATWSTDRERETPLVICVSDDAELRHALLELSNRDVNGKPIAVRRLGTQSPSTCHVAFVEGDDASPEGVKTLVRHNVLVVSADRGFANYGTIELVPIGRQTRFKVNNTVAKASEVSLSSRLLRLAVEVR